MARKLADHPGIRRNVILAPYTTWRIGGPAAYLLEPRSEDDLLLALELARAERMPISVIGRGSNVLVDDKGVRGLVVVLQRSLSSHGIDAGVGTVGAGAGVPLPMLARRAAAGGVAGFDFLIGIPGSVGGGVIMNAGIGGRSGRCLDDVLVSARVIETPSATVRTLNRAACGLRYRGSTIGDRGWIVLSVTFVGTPGHESGVLFAEQRRITQRRREKQPLTRKTSGSVFVHPEGTHSAGWYLDRCGLKGYRVGGASVSHMHANWIENTGDAKADDVRELMDVMRSSVLERFGIALVAEIRHVPGNGSEDRMP